jgi:hypothetical protein
MAFKKRFLGCVSKWERFFAFLADSSRALQACGQGTASAVQVGAI